MHQVDTMQALLKKDKGGRRCLSKRRSNLAARPVLEKRASQDRRSGQDRRTNPDPVIRITGDERRQALREMDTT